MRSFEKPITFFFIAAYCVSAFAQQRLQEREQEFMQSPPLINSSLPEVTIWDADGKPFNTADLRGHYTVLTFGCLTCPPSIWNISGLEAVHRDYSPKGVHFYFIYKSLAHPELAGNYIQPFTLEERLTQSQRAKVQFGTKIPWIVDAMDNRLKHALGDRPNAQFLIDPDGRIVRKRAWANPREVRKDLEELVGPVERITEEEDLQLELTLPKKSGVPRGVLKRIPRPNMLPITMRPELDPKDPPFYAKLRAEADNELLNKGSGRLYLGFHLDPIHDAHWNNLMRPLSFEIEKVDGVNLGSWTATAESVQDLSDADPREFMIDVESWPTDNPLRLTVTYFACLSDDTCNSIRQSYVLERRRDFDGGGARGEGAGFWNPEDFARQLLRGDGNKDGKLNRAESVGIVLPHFDKLDKDQDGFISLKELQTIGNWLNYHHQPGTPPVNQNIEP